MFQPEKFYILLSLDGGYYKLSAGPFEMFGEAYRDLSDSYDTHDRLRIHIVKGKHNKNAEKVDLIGEPIGREVKREKVLVID